jgi:hypothetical protein
VRSTARAADLGGTVEFGPIAIDGVGHSTVVTDPTGASHGLWQAAGFDGFGALGELGTPSWFDHSSADPDAAAPYYRELLGVDLYEEPPAMRILVDEGEWFASISFDQAGRSQPMWSPIYVVDTLAGARERALGAGGAVLIEEMPVPGSSIAVIADPVYGVAFTIAPA